MEISAASAAVQPAATAVFEGVAILICISWIWVNVYHYYPMLASGLGSLFGRLAAEGTVTASGTRSGFVTGSQPESRPSLTLSEKELPTVDVLLPAYHEEDVIEHSIASVRSADYPQEKLTLSVLVEPDDRRTRAALERIEDRYDFDTVVVPELYPGDPNKPRALNYGFERTDGDVVGLTDAEDVVHPKLYRRVAEKLDGGSDYVQGRLDMVNENDGWMNLLFRAEYGYWYLVNTWAKYNRGYPIPLGGTTCFVPREVLESMSKRRLEKYGDPWSEADWRWVRGRGLEGYRPWDPRNVTEDFELGLFLWQEGYEAGYVKSTPTSEESPLSLHAWVRQRTRWKKGKIYTLMQYVRQPPDTLREKIHVYTQSAVPHLGPINLLAIAVILLGANLVGYPLHPVTATVLLVGFLMASVIVVLYSYGYWLVSDQSRATRLRRAVVVAPTLPVYWLMQWLADMRAIQQTYAGELHWAKTTHFGRNVGADERKGMSVLRGRSVGTNGGVRELDEGATGPGKVLSTPFRVVALAVVLVLGAALRANRLADWSLFGDELYSVTSRGALPVGELLAVPVPLDSHPPLYYLLLHYWMELFGNSVTGTRSMSVVLSIGAMGMLFLLGTELFDDRVGLLATLLFAVSTFQIHYGRVARMYSLFVLLTLASWYGFVRLREGTVPTAAGYVVATALLVYTHVFGLFVVAAQSVYVLLSERTAGIGRRRWIGLQAAVGVLVLPWLGVLMHHVFSLLTGAREGSIISWVPKPGIGIVTNTVLRYVGWPHHFPLIDESWGTRAVASLLVIVYAICLVLAIIRYTSDKEYEFANLPVTGQLSTLFAVPIALPFLFSYLVVPVYYPRFTIPASVALFLLVAAGIVNIKSRRRRYAVLAIVLLCSAVLVSQYYATDTRAEWEGSAACINEGAAAGDAVLYQTFWTQGYVEYYQDTPGVEKFGVLSPDEIGASRTYGMNLSQVESVANDSDRIWLFQYQPSEENRLLSTLRETHHVTLARDHGNMWVFRLERGSAGATGASGVPDGHAETGDAVMENHGSCGG